MKTHFLFHFDFDNNFCWKNVIFLFNNDVDDFTYTSLLCWIIIGVWMKSIDFIKRNCRTLGFSWKIRQLSGGQNYDNFSGLQNVFRNFHCVFSFQTFNVLWTCTSTLALSIEIPAVQYSIGSLSFVILKNIKVHFFSSDKDSCLIFPKRISTL